MTVRAMWKGIIHFGEIRVPVKLYAAIEDRSVHFRLLHRKDQQPVKQFMINPTTEKAVPYQETRRAFVTDDGDMVLLAREELEVLAPEKSRDIKVITFLPLNQIDYSWYDRPYYLGPDDSGQEYFALIDALEDTNVEGLAHWVMRNKEYFGALRLYQGYPILMSLRSAQEVISVDALEPPGGGVLDKRELSMAHRLIEMLEAKFEPKKYSDKYRTRLLELIAAKAQGKQVKRKPARLRKRPGEDLTTVLEASLKQLRKSA